MNKDAILNALIAEARHTIGCIEDMPGWVSEAGIDMPNTDKLERLIDSYERFSRSKPDSSKEFLAALIASSGHLTADAIGARWAITDGSSVAIVDAAICDASGLKSRFFNAAFAVSSAMIAEEPTHSVTLAQIDEWESKSVLYEGRVVGCIGGMPFDAARIVDWGANLARLTSGPLLVRLGDKRIVLAGQGWEMATMQLHIKGELDAPELLSVTP